MIIPTCIKLTYDYYYPQLEQLNKRVNETLKLYTDAEHYPYNSRIKTLESLSEKIETGRYKSWKDIDDLFAARIIIPNLTEEEKVLNKLKSTFECISIKKRGDSKKPHDVFRFDTTRFIGKLKSYGEKRDLFSEIKFEIQIPTAFEHAWAVTTYPFAYKSSEINWRYFRLSAQIKASVEQLDMIVSGAQEIHKFITESKWPELDFKLKIQKFFNDPSISNIIPEEVKPKNLSRFIDNIYALIKDLLNDKQQKNNYKKFKEIFIIIKNEIEFHTKETFPRSISLYQFFLGTLIKHNKIEFSASNFTPFITDQLKDIFPETKTIKSGFNCELDSIKLYNIFP